MFSLLKKLWNDKRGNVIAITAAAMPVIIGAAGLSVDTIQWTLWKRQIQRAADSAAMAGVYDRVAAGGSTATISSTVSHDIAMNLHSARSVMTGYPDVKFDGDCPVNGAAMANRVCVTLAVQYKLPFSSLFMTTAPVIKASATAAGITTSGAPCIFATETGSTTGVTFSGNTDVYSPDCDIFSNSKGSDAAIGKGSAKVTANAVGAVGGVQQSNNFTVKSYRPYSSAMTDPFKDIDLTTSTMKAMMKGPCDSQLKPGDTLTVGGNNCFTSLDVGSNETLTIPDNFGPIFIDAGGADIKGDFSCKGCTIILTNKSAASPIGNLKVNAGANINMTPPTSGTFKGLSIFQDKRATDCSNCNKINGNSASIVEGAIYFPSQELQYNGTGTTAAICTMFIARRIEFTGNSGISNKFDKLSNCGKYGMDAFSAGSTIVRLVA